MRSFRFSGLHSFAPLEASFCIEAHLPNFESELEIYLLLLLTELIHPRK